MIDPNTLSEEDRKLYQDNQAAVDARFNELMAEKQQEQLAANEESGVARPFAISPERERQLFEDALHGTTSTTHAKDYESESVPPQTDTSKQNRSSANTAKK